MSTINYAIEITTNATGISSATYGITAGVFRLVTGRPGYTGAAPYPTWEDTSDNTEVWYEGLMLLDSMSSPNREVDISQTGEYGSMSGFNFSFVNTSMIWKYVEDNSIYLMSRRVRLFSVIDGVYLQIWDGVIQNAERDETGYHISCIDSYRKAHDYLPKNIINKSNLEGVENQDQGDPIPLVFGDANYVKLKSIKALINGAAQLGQRSSTDTTPVKVGAIAYYAIQNITTYKNVWIKLITHYKIFATDALKGKFLHFKAGKDADTEALIRIMGNEVTTTQDVGTSPKPYITWYTTTIYLDEYLPGVDPTLFQKIYYEDEETALNYLLTYQTTKAQWMQGSTGQIGVNITGIGITQDGWWCEVLDVTNELIVSDGVISGAVKNANGAIQLYAYDKDNNRYYTINDMVDSVTVDAAGRTILKLLNNNLTYSGEIKVITDLPITSVARTSYTILGKPNDNLNTQAKGDATTLLSKTQLTTPVPATAPALWYEGKSSNNVDVPELRQTFEVELDADIDYSKYEELSIGFDMAYRYVIQGMALGTEKPLSIRWSLEVIDTYGQAIKFFSTSGWVGRLLAYESDPLVLNVENSSYSGAGQVTNQLQFLPKDYYRNTGVTYTGDSLYNTVQLIDTVMSPVADWLLLPTEFTDMLKTGVAKSFRISIYTDLAVSDKIKFSYWTLGQVGLFGKKTIDSIDGDLYTVVKGLLNGTDETNNVYQIFKYILETNDSIAAADIDYGNLATTRNTWWAGRQLLDRKNSYDYLNELCAQSFVAMFPTREGKRKMQAWREVTAISATHDGTSIVRDSIRDYGKTPLNKVYNHFYLLYSFDQAFKKYLRAMYIDKINQSAFPAEETETDPSIGPDWTQYCGGVGPGTYADSKDMWGTCHRSYLRDNTPTPDLPVTMSQLNWYHDLTISDPANVVNSGVDSSVFKYLTNCTEWLTRQKDYASYSIPMTADNIKAIDLVSKVYFDDLLYTDDRTYTGWITRISYNIKAGTIDITTMFEPYQPQTYGGDGLIVERGSVLNTDTVTESGSQPDTVTETGV